MAPRARVRIALTLVIGLILGAATTALGVGGIPGSDNLIHGCYSTTTGIVRVVAQDEPCTKAEAAIAWTTKAYVDATTTSGLASEATTRAAADASLTTALNSETSARTSGDSTLATGLSGEISARQTAISGLTSSLASEASARVAGDGTLASDLAAEISARQGADSGLATSISNEATARAGGDASTLTAAKAYTDTKTAAASSNGYELVQGCSNVHWVSAAIPCNPTSSFDLPGLQSRQFYISCPAGKVALSGGFTALNSLGIQESNVANWYNSIAGVPQGTAWLFHLYNPGVISTSVYPSIVCATP